MIKHTELEETHQDHWVPLLALHRHRRSPTMCLIALSKAFWTQARGCDHFLGSLFQCSNALLAKNLFLISNLKLSPLGFVPFSWVLSLVSRVKRLVPAPPLSLVRILKTSVRSLLSLLRAEQTKHSPCVLLCKQIKGVFLLSVSACNLYSVLNHCLWCSELYNNLSV